GANSVQITLLEKNITATINDGETSQVSLDNGASVTFRGDFITADGNPYNGAVVVVNPYISPNTVATIKQKPGGLFAQDADNDARYLETYGMVTVNLFSPSGEVLNIDPNSPATIEFPIDFSQSSTAPETIKMWHFDETQGYWKEDGQATRDGNNYVGEVTHFTWWNCDIPADLVELCFTITPTNTAANTPYFVILKSISNGNFIYSGELTSLETECGFIPENEDIEIQIFASGISNDCAFELIHQETLGSYTTNATATITFQETLTVTQITGTATNCNGNPITNGYLYIDNDHIFNITNGIIDIGVQSCVSASEIITVQLFDFDTSQWGIIENVSIANPTVNIGTMSTCETSGGIFNGNLTLATQQQVDDFGVLGFTTINGFLVVGDTDNITDINDISPLASITTIADYLLIGGNQNLTSLTGVENINSLGAALIIKNNASLTSLSGFTSLTNINSIIIENNEALTSIVGFTNTNSLEQSLTVSKNENLTSLQGIEVFDFNSQKDLRIIDNDALTSLQGVENITQTRFLNISDNDALTSLTAFQSLTQVLDLSIRNNDALITLLGLEQLAELRILIIADNENLQNLNGLENLVTLTPSIFNAVNIGGIQWENFCTGYIDGPNPNLSDFCAIQTLMNTHQWDINGNSQCAVIVNNAYNPTVQDFINGNCSQ
ncbi:MAG: hypothetical protein AAF617_07505, partial [Bacteroidota bacterium]